MNPLQHISLLRCYAYRCSYVTRASLAAVHAIAWHSKYLLSRACYEVFTHHGWSEAQEWRFCLTAYTPGLVDWLATNPESV